MAQCYENLQDYFQTHFYYKKAIDNGNVNAMYSLGKIFENGWGVAKDIKQAIKLYKEADEKGHKYVMWDIARCYEELGDFKQAIVYHKIVMDKEKDPIAMRKLGEYYQKGIGIERNVQMVLKLYHGAAEKWDMEAMFNLGLCYDKGTEVPQDYQKALEFYLQAAESGLLQ